VKKESKKILKYMTLNDESELEYPLSSGFLRQNCSWGGAGVKVD